MIARRRRARRAAIAIAAALAGAACGPAAGPAEGPAPSSIAAIHRARCGACHTIVEPGTRTRAHLEEALARHRRRVHLTEEQWRQMIDYLAGPPAPAASAR